MLTVVVLVESLVIKSMKTSENLAPVWMTKVVGFIQSYQFDFLCLGLHVSDAANEDQRDENNLIGNPSKVTTNNAIWLNICSIFDKTFMIAIIAVYVVLFFTLIPFKYSANNNAIKEIN